ncbi:MAG TPA: SdrD B-like domain-containing protein, partial [Allosphingosinicella sp.]
MAVSFTITRKTSLFHDIDGDNIQDSGELAFIDLDGDGVMDPGEVAYDQDEAGVFDPGDTLYTRITITNSGDQNATGVTIGDNFAGSSIVVGTLNISPIAFNDSFTAVGNTVLRVGTASTNTINGGESTLFVGNLLTNDAGDVAGGVGLGPIAADQVQGFKIDVVTSGVSANGGKFNIFADGTFNYVNDGTDTTLTTDSFSYKIRDKGLDGQYGTYDDLTSTGTVTITFALQGAAGSPAHRVWYIDGTNGSDSTGDGTSANPFQTMTKVNGVTGDGTTNDDLDAAGEYIYVENSVSGSITLEGGQQLIGTGDDLIVNGSTLAADSGTNSSLTGSGAFAVTLGTGNTIAGINLTGPGGGAGISGLNFGTLTVTDDVVLNAGGIALSLVGGTFAGTGFASTTSSGGTNNINLSDVAGTVALGATGTLSGATGNAVVIVNSGGAALNTGLSFGGAINYTGTAALLSVDGGTAGHTGTISLTGTKSATSGTGLNFENADGSYTISGTTTLNGGDAGIDILSNTSGNGTQGSAGSFVFGGTFTINNPGGSALVISDSSATVSVDVDVTQASNFAAVDVTNHSGGTLTFQPAASINATNGTGLQFSNADGTYNFNGTNTLNGGDAGIDIDTGSDGTFTFSSNSSITNPTGVAFNVTTGTANIDYNGTIAKTGTSNGLAVSVAGHTGGTISFDGQVTASGSGDGVSLTNNQGTTFEFTGGLSLDTSGSNSTGFLATGASGAGSGGTISVTGTNTINSGQGTALNITNTNIAAADVTFRSISSSGGTATGIIVDTTGSLGGLHVTGNGGAGTGGTIASKTGNDGLTSQGIGIYLNNTADVQLAWMQLNDFTNFGIRGLDVNGFAMSNSVIQSNISAVSKNGTSNALDEGSVSFGVSNGTTGLTGTATLTNVQIQDGFENGFALFNKSGTVNLVMNNVDVTGSGNDGIVTQNFGTATVNIEVKNSDLSANVGDHFNATADNSANLNVLFGNNGKNILTGGAPSAQGQGITIQTGVGWSGTGSANISNNEISGSVDSPIIVNIGGTGTFGATINNNIIGKDGVAGSGTPVGSNKDAIRIVANGDKSTDPTPDGGTLNVLIMGNTVQNVSGRGLHVIGRDGGTAADPIRLNVTIIGNTFRQSLNSTGQAILLESGASSAPISDYVILHADIGGAGARANIFSDDWGVSSPDMVDRDEIRILNTITNNRFLITGYVGGATSEAQVEAYLFGRNTFSAGGVVGSSLGGSNTWEGGGTPTQPISASEFAPLPQQLYELAAEEEAPADAGPAPTPGTGEGGGETPPADPVPAGPVVIDDGILSQTELGLLVEAAIQRWIEAGATEAQVAAMRAVDVNVADLAGLTLGASDAGTITLDSDAAGWRWFIDSTPGDDSEYAGSGTRLAAVDPLGLAGTRIDLLTVLTHELGHQIGLSDLAAPGLGDELMFGTIGAGERRLPGSDDLAGAAGGPVAGGFAFAPVSLGTIPAGQTVTVEFRHVINAPAEDGLAGSWTGQSTVHSNQIPAQTSNLESGAIDSLTLGNLVYNDINKNGVFDAGDSGIQGVSVSLYADSNNSGGWDSGDAQVGVSQLTLAGGLYSFAGLAPGDYIVVVNASSFNSGQPLNGKVSVAGGADPDNNVDNDDNGIAGVAGLGSGIASQTITLAYGSEPDGTPDVDGDADADTNLSLDFGFITPNAAPTSTNLAGDIASYVEGAAPVKLDVGTAATLSDNNANFAGGTLTVSIGAGADTADDVLSIGTTATVTLDTGNTVKVGGTTIGTYAGGTGGTALTITFNSSATPANVDDLLQALQYNNTDLVNPSNDARAVSITLVDGAGNDGGLGADTLVIGTVVNVTDVNDAPEGGPGNGDTTNDSTTLVFDATDFSTGFTDSDGNAFAGIVISSLPATGKLQLNTVDITAPATIPLAQLGGALTFVPDPAAGPGSVSFNYAVYDDGGGANTDTTPGSFTITITATAAAPVIDLNAGDPAIDNTAAYTENAGPTVLSTILTVSDADDTHIESATVSVGTGFKTSADVLTVGVATFGTDVPTGISWSYNGATGILTLTGSSTLANYQAILRQVGFESTSNAPGTSRVVNWKVNDGTSDSAIAKTVITITEQNDSPNGTTAATPASEDTFKILSVSTFGFTDPDTGDSLSAVTITAFTGSGSLYYDADGSAGSGDPVAIPSLPQTYTAADLAAGKLLYKAAANANGNALATIDFQVTDSAGQANSTDPVANTLTINVSAVNDTPDITAAGPVTGTEQTASALLTGITVSDADLDAKNFNNGDYAGSTLIVSGDVANNANDLFSIDPAPGAGFTVDGSTLKAGGSIFATFSTASNQLQINFTSAQTPATSALADEVMQSIRYTYTGDNPPNLVQIVATFVDGAPGGGQGNGTNFDSELITVNITPVNDAPTVTAADTTVSGTEDTDLVFKSTSGNAITVTDPDNASLTATLTVTSGTLKLFQTTGLTTVTGDGTGTVVLTGSAAHINAALEGLIYRGNLNYQGSDTLGVKIDDGTVIDTENVAITLADDGFINGDSGDNVLHGTPQMDIFLLHQGGIDFVIGYESNDLFVFRGALTSHDKVDGREGRDQITIQGDYKIASPLTLGTEIVNVESFVLTPGNDTRRGDPGTGSYSYHVTTVNENVASGEVMTFDGARLRLGEDFTFR